MAGETVNKETNLQIPTDTALSSFLVHAPKAKKTRFED